MYVIFIFCFKETSQVHKLDSRNEGVFEGARKAETKIVDSKEISTKGIKEKLEAWKTIEKEMSALGYDIPLQRLKEQWNRIKTQARTSLSEFTKQRKATGGGECPKQPSEFDFIVADMTLMDIEKDECLFDSDNFVRKFFNCIY